MTKGDGRITKLFCMKSTGRSVASLIQEAFPPVSRPSDSELTVHGEACRFCSLVIEDFKDEKGVAFAPERARLLLGELSTLSPAGFRWVLPSYLAAIFADEANLDLGEFLAYHFCGELREDEQAEREAPVQVLSDLQIDCLIRILSEIRSALGSAYHESADEAVAFLSHRRKGLAEKDAP
jgi:hypothetical protein